MDRGFPSLAALLGLLAVAGFQNRDKLSEMFGSGGNAPGGGGYRPTPDSRTSVPPAGGQAPAGGGFLDQLRNTFGGATGGGVGGLLGGGLSELVDRFRQSGQGDTVDSWVGSGANREVAPNDLERAIGPDLMRQLAQQTGLSRDELLSRLSRELPRAVDQYTPGGRVPTAADFR